jgi:hypothetical protein
MTEAQSATTFLLGDRLPWPDDAAVPQETGPLDAAVLHNSGLRSDCSIRKISAIGATLRPRMAAAPGESLALELGTGQRVSGTIDWARNGEIGMQFAQPIDVLALINRTLVSQPVDRRAMPRVELRCNAWIKYAQDFSPAVVRNISARGLQLEGSGLPAKGTYVSVFVEGLNIPPGEIVWTQGKLAGIELLEELSWSSIMPWIRGLVRNEPQ